MAVRERSSAVLTLLSAGDGLSELNAITLR
jgi:hypothetical protein